MTTEERLKEWLDIQIKAIRDNGLCEICEDGELSACNLSLYDDRIHVSEATINTMRDVLGLPVYCSPRDDEEYPFEIFIYYENVRFFRISDIPYEEVE